MTTRHLARVMRDVPCLVALAMTFLAVGLSSTGWCSSVEADSALRREAIATLHKASEYFQDHVATEGGYLWNYSADLRVREGEEKTSDSTVWITPPGTPSVGLAFLAAYQATGDPDYLDAARDAGDCLVRGQLRSGGWTYRIEFDPAQRTHYAYRVDKPPKDGAHQKDVTTLDDNTTQSALLLLIRLDQTLGFKDAAIHGAAIYALDSLLRAQYPNGAWPQRYEHAPDAAAFPVRKASYPTTWPRTHPKTKYSACYTFNDNAISDTINVLLEAARIYHDDRYVAAARRGGDFILLAQMPEPQPAWAQQYDAETHPVWARRFEPPAVTGGESQGVVQMLLNLYRQTGDKKYLKPISRALAYLEDSRLPDGQLARFYELKTNKPLYFTKDYKLTYRDDDLPTHYCFKMGSALEQLRAEYDQLARHGPAASDASAARPPAQPTPELVARTRRAIASLDDQGRWVENGSLHYQGPNDPTRRVIRCWTFIENIRTLAAYIAATRSQPPSEQHQHETGKAEPSEPGKKS